MVYGIPTAGGDSSISDSESTTTTCLPSFFGQQEDSDGNTATTEIMREDESNNVGLDEEEDDEETTNNNNPIEDDDDNDDGLEDDDSTCGNDEENWDGWNLADCFLDKKRATTRWRLLGSHNCSVPIKHKYLNDDNCTATINVPISIIEMKPKTGRYHQLRRTMAWLYDTPIVGDSVYAKDHIEENYMPPNNDNDNGNTAFEIIEKKTTRDYRASLMLCSNEIDIAHPHFNTVAGRIEWKGKMLPSSSSSSQSATTATTKNDMPLSSSSCSLYENKDGVVRVNAEIKLPQKFTKFITMMERAQERKKATTELGINKNSPKLAS